MYCQMASRMPLRVPISIFTIFCRYGSILNLGGLFSRLNEISTLVLSEEFRVRTIPSFSCPDDGWAFFH